MIIAAETASGKTEAAFLPILTLIQPDPIGSVRVLYVGPLKALINDQFQRLELLCDEGGKEFVEDGLLAFLFIVGTETLMPRTNPN